MSQKRLKYGLLMPHGVKAISTPQDVVSLAIAAEEGGWDGFFIWDNLGQAMSDTAVVLAAIAVQTKRIKIGPMVTGVPRRRPWKLAKEIITLDLLSEGRIIFGAGLGEGMFYEKFGEETDDKIRAEKLDESLEILNAFMSGKEVNFEGKHYKVDSLTYKPPVQSPRVPIWVAGFWPKKGPFRRAAKWDGIMPHTTRVVKDENAILSTEEVEASLKFIQDHREGTLDNFSYVMLNPIPEDEEKKQKLLEKYQKLGVSWWVDSVYEWSQFDREMETLEPLIAKIKAGPPNY